MQFSVTAIVALGALLFTSKVMSAEGQLRKREIQRHLVQIRSYGGNPLNEFRPLGLCEGDCDEDNDCQGALICFQRGHNQAIPAGCEGGLEDNSRTDYCIHDLSKSLSLAPSSGPSSAPSPGDEDEAPTSNSPSSSPSVSQEELAETPSLAPSSGPSSAPSPRVEDEIFTSEPSARPSPEPSLSFQPSELPTTPNHPLIEERPLWPIRFFGRNPNDDKLPLGPCYGNCRSDDDCDDGLYCHPRGPYGPSPGCIDPELDGSNNQFCAYLEEDPPPTLQPTSDFFRLKLYWQEGYDWQEESFEREFCMKCKNGCMEGHSIYVSECSSYSSYFDFVEITDSDEIMIKVSDEDRNLCFERAERTVSLATCDETLQTQRWFARDGSFAGDKFEISQVNFENYCLSQPHYPKHGELIQMDRCGNAIRDTTEFWNKY